VSLRYLPILCVALLLGAWVIDLVTPQLFVAAILLDVPIVLSSFARNRRFTLWLVVAALSANVIAGYVNGIQSGHHWDIIGVGDRALAAISILLVGFLSIGTQESAQRTGELAERRRQIEREGALRRAIEAMRSSVNPEYIDRTIVREATSALDADVAVLFVAGAELVPVTLRFERGAADVQVANTRPPPELLSLVARAQGEADPVALSRGDALGRLILDTLQADYVLAAPLVDRNRSYGVLVVARREATGAFDAQTRELTRAFVDQASAALSQADLFIALAERNEEFAGANRELAARSEVIRDIVYALSHDLRTPLAAAQMTIRQALDGAYGELPEHYREILRQSLVANGELQRLADTLLLVARYESGEQSPIRESVDLTALANSVLAELRPLYESKHVSARLVEEPHVHGIVTGDESELRRAIVNLVANAVTWTPENGSIEVAVDVRDEEVETRVEDDGYGVPESIRPSLFGRLVARDSRRGAGSGLGLYIVRRIVENHGGRVAYAPREPRGSVFTMALPRTAEVRIGKAV
jgi:signal transduction histidine kinase